MPQSIEALKLHPKSAIYRLGHAGRDGTSVIAKHCLAGSAANERTIYEGILRHLPVTSVQFLGLVPGQEHGFAWLFLEDAGDEKFSPSSAEHRRLAAQWLGRAHAAAANLAAAARLPDRGPDHYLGHLRSGRDAIGRSLDNPVLSADNLDVLRAIMLHADALERSWNQVEHICADMPSTLVHGDFRPKNVRVRRDGTGTSLFPLDWETAGWGVPAPDLASARGISANPHVDLDAYESVVQERWPRLDLPAIRQLVTLGTLFHVLAAINWASLALGQEWLDKPMASMDVYQGELAQLLQSPPWE